MQPIDLEKYEIALVHQPFGTKTEDIKVPRGTGWWLHELCPEGRRSVGGVHLLFRREREAPTVDGVGGAAPLPGEQQ